MTDDEFIEMFRDGKPLLETLKNVYTTGYEDGRRNTSEESDTGNTTEEKETSVQLDEGLCDTTGDD